MAQQGQKEQRLYVGKGGTGQWDLVTKDAGTRGQREVEEGYF